MMTVKAILMLDEDGNIVAETVTDENGNYVFDDLVPGNYSVGYSNNTDYASDSSAAGSEGGAT